MEFSFDSLRSRICHNHKSRNSTGSGICTLSTVENKRHTTQRYNHLTGIAFAPPFIEGRVRDLENRVIPDRPVITPGNEFFPITPHSRAARARLAVKRANLALPSECGRRLKDDFNGVPFLYLGKSF